MSAEFYTINFYEAGRYFERWMNLTKEEKEREEREREDIGV